jgi:hypothetical protein
MTDHQLSTRDLATRPDSDDPDTSRETQQAADQATDANPTSDQASESASSQRDASPTREPAAGQRADSRAAETATDQPVSGGSLGSDPGDTRMHDAAGTDSDHEPLFPSDQGERFTTRWQEIQTSFVDQPRDAVAEADTLVADLMQRLASSFSKERERLEAQWDRGDDVSTEDLRVALTRYRSFFDRLLSA